MSELERILKLVISTQRYKQMERKVKRQGEQNEEVQKTSNEYLKLKERAKCFAYYLFPLVDITC